MKRTFLSLLALVALAAAASAEPREIELATLRVQRVDPEEIRWGTQTDAGELTYGIYSDGTASGWVGTPDGMKMLRDPDTIRVVKVKKLDPDSFIVYPTQPSDATHPVILTGDNEFSIFNVVSGGTTNYHGAVAETQPSRELNVMSLTERTRIAKVTYEIENHVYSIEGAVTNWCSSTHGQDLNAGRFASKHVVKFSSGYINMNDNPPGCTVKNIEVWGYDGELDTSEIDASIVGVTVHEQDGRSYDLGKVHKLVEEIHHTQDRWAHYPAAADVDLHGEKLFSTGDRFVWLSDDGGLGMKLASDAGDLFSVDRGNLAGGALVKGFEINTNGTVSIFVTTRFSDTFKTYAAATVDGTYSQVSHVNRGIVRHGDLACYELVCSALVGDAGFYKVAAVVDAADERAPSVTIHTDKLYFGAGKTALSLYTVTNGTNVVSILATGDLGALGGGGGSERGADMVAVSNVVRDANTQLLAEAPDAVALASQKAIVADLWARVDALEDADGSDVLTAAQTEALVNDRVSSWESMIQTWSATHGAMPIQSTNVTQVALNSSSSTTDLAIELSPLRATEYSGSVQIGIASFSGVGLNPSWLVFKSGVTSVSFPTGSKVKGSFSSGNDNFYRISLVDGGLIVEKVYP